MTAGSGAPSPFWLASRGPARSVPPKRLEPIRRQRRVAGRILEITMPQVSLQGPRIDAVIRKLVAAGVAQHMGVRFDAEIRHDGCPLDHAREARRRERRAALRREYEGRLGRCPSDAGVARVAPARSAGGPRRFLRDHRDGEGRHQRRRSEG
jgi:hypothetical protein